MRIASRVLTWTDIGYLPWLLLIAGSLMLTGCVSSQPSSQPSLQPSPQPSQGPSSAPQASAPAPNPASTSSERAAEPLRAVEADLRAASERWAGVPHEWGGATRRGVDCSGLVQNLYADVFGRSLPRTTEEQAQVGQRVPRRQLQPGDLVFFRPEWRKRHVGVYLSDGEFVHASSSSGVTVSRLDDRYWDRRWWQARRVVAAPSPADSTRPPARRSAPRTGW